jgi:hypothetical protein
LNVSVETGELLFGKEAESDHGRQALNCCRAPQIVERGSHIGVSLLEKIEEPMVSVMRRVPCIPYDRAALLENARAVPIERRRVQGTKVLPISLGEGHPYGSSMDVELGAETMGVPRSVARVVERDMGHS